MIERKRGHIVGISSVAGKISLPTAVAYTTTKHGVRAFMESLRDELIAFEHDKFVQTTTVFPYFISTRKELDDVLEEYNKFHSVLTVEEVADRVIEGIKKNELDVTIPRTMSWLSFVKLDKNLFSICDIFNHDFLN
jgi:all-trans-retinol dehydrogenase (NAD+)